MTNIRAFLKKYKTYLIIGLVVVVIVALVALGHGKNSNPGYAVAKTDVTQSVVLSGKVQTSDRADLGFAASGRVGKIFVQNNQAVKTGAVLAQLEIQDLLADLKIKQLNSTTSDVTLKSAKDNLDRVTSQENTKVDSAYRKLLSEDLILVPDEDDSAIAPPTVSGLYGGGEGQYKIIVDKDPTNSSKEIIRVFGLERVIVNLNEKSSTEIGTKGLYISFPQGDASPYRDTTWILDIPNKAGDSYVANSNAYNEAKDARDVAIKDAQSNYDELLSERGGGDSVAQAEVQKIQAEIAKNTIYAPFDGRVTNIEKEVGENASVGERVISILGESKLEVVLQVSELDVSKLVLGSSIALTLDAFPGETFNGTLSTVNSRDTTVEGVPVYEAFVELPADARIKTGMSANGIIILASKAGVLAVPSYLITKEGDTSSVEVETADGKTAKREITTGLMGTNSMVEIVSGLKEGDVVADTSKK
ncbi:MAG: efflux RND transporter periplasmic adaptor subunit [bacterium]